MTEQVYSKKQEKEQVPKQVLKQKVVYAPQVEVYYWGPSIKNLQIGHLALRIIDDEEDIYISHWPKVTIKCLNSEPAHKLSFINDMEDEGRGPDEYLHIPDHMIYVKSVKKWWTRFLKDARKGTENYKLLKNNCAQVVYRALRAGSFPHFFEFDPPTILPCFVKVWVKRQKGVTFKKDK